MRPPDLRRCGVALALMAETAAAGGGRGIGVVPVPGLDRDDLRWVAEQLRAAVEAGPAPGPAAPFAASEPAGPFAASEPASPFAASEPAAPFAASEPASPFAAPEPAAPFAASVGGLAPTEPEVAASSLILRHELRLQGFDGPLRGPLRLPADPPPEPAGRLEVAAGIEGLVPGASVTERAGGVLVRLARRAVGRVGAMADFDVAVDDGPLRFQLSVPERDDLAVEAVAVVVDTLRRVGERFPRLGSSVRAVSLDRYGQHRSDTAWVGMAHGTIGVVHLRADMFLVDELAPYVRRTEMGPGPWPPPQLPVPYAAHEEVTVHECWHQLELDFEARRYRDSIEFRRRLGRWFGVETLEQAVLGKDRRAERSWRAAYWRLVQEVSDYAGTSPKEATAELFAQWWGAPPPRPPMLEMFGELLDEFIDQA